MKNRSVIVCSFLLAVGTLFTFFAGVAAGEDAPKVASAEVIASVVKAANPDSCARHIVLVGSLLQKDGSVHSHCAEDNEDLYYAGFADGETVHVKFTSNPAVVSSNLYMWDDPTTNLHQTRVLDFKGTVVWDNNKRCQPDGGTVPSAQMRLAITYGDLFFYGQLVFIEGEKVAAVIGCGWEAPTTTTTAPSTTTTAEVTTTTAAITTTTEAPTTTNPPIRSTFPTNVTVQAGVHEVGSQDAGRSMSGSVTLALIGLATVIGLAVAVPRARALRVRAGQDILT